MHKYRYLKEHFPSDQVKGLLLLTGARQVGKTTLVKSVFENTRYINLDAPENREMLREVSSSSWGRDIGCAIVDEAQKEPIVFDKIKYAYDQGAISFSLILGSSQILLMKKIRESLAGRVSIYELWPLLMSEIQSGSDHLKNAQPLMSQLISAKKERIQEVLNSIPASLLDQEDVFFKDAEKHLLRWGGMPALLPLSDDQRMKWLKDYEYTYLERDLSDLARIDNLIPFRKFQQLAALRSASLLSYSELARDAGMSVDTARRYLEYLRLSYQVVLLQPYYKNLTSSLVKTPKIYWLDIGILRILSGYHNENTGAVYETMVVSELIKWIKTVQAQAECYFYRTRSGLEVDLIVETPQGIVGLEAKASHHVMSIDAKSMKSVAQKLGSAWQGGFVIYSGNFIKKIAEPNIWAIPSRRFFGQAMCANN